jgi:hypothetical protein
MCKLNRTDFNEARICKNQLQKLLHSETDVSIIVDTILTSNNLNSLLYVLAATVLEKSSIVNAEYKQATQKWAEKYYNKIGFLSESIMIKNAPTVKIENLIYYVTKRK